LHFNVSKKVGMHRIPADFKNLAQLRPDLGRILTIEVSPFEFIKPGASRAKSII
jgi:hypothetical protein